MAALYKHGLETARWKNRNSGIVHSLRDTGEVLMKAGGTCGGTWKMRRHPNVIRQGIEADKLRLTWERVNR